MNTNQLIVLIVILLILFFTLSMLKKAVKFLIFIALIIALPLGSIVHLELAAQKIKDVVSSSNIQETITKLPKNMADKVKIITTEDGDKLEYKILFLSKVIDIKDAK